MESRLLFWCSGSETEKYSLHENEKYIIWLSGLLYYGESDADRDIFSIVSRFERGELDFNKLHGFYRLVIFDKNSESFFFWGDNSSSQYFFIDETRGLFSDSFLSLVRGRRGNISLCHEAAVQLISNIIFDELTLVEGIVRSSPEKYYRFVDKKIETLDKGLHPFCQCSGEEVFKITESLLAAARDWKCGAVCTGGTDSRVILSYLSYKNVLPPLVITGHADNPDVAVAEIIADKLGLPLSFIDPAEKSGDWLEKAFEFSDGCYDSVLSYRHLQVLHWAEEKDVNCIYGGVGGEFYKNSFCFPVRHRAFAKAFDSLRLFRLLVSSRMKLPAWAGEELLASRSEFISRCERDLSAFREEGSVLNGFNRFGYQILRNRAGAVTNAFAGRCTRIDPLMDREAAAKISHKNPWLLSMYIWHRRQIARYCKALCDIPTDQGYTCTVRPVKLFFERVIKGLYWANKALARFGFAQRKTVDYWRADYIEARSDPLFRQGFDICKKIGVISQNANESDIENSQLGNIILIGQLFSLK